MGGLLGWNQGKVAERYTLSKVKGKDIVGGLIGRMWSYQNSEDSILMESFSLGFVEGEENVGGLVGWNDGIILRCYSQSLVTVITSLKGIAVGGLVGYNGSGSIIECYSAGKVKGSNHGLVGKNSEGKVLDSYWDIDISCCADSDGGVGRNTTQMKRKYSLSDPSDPLPLPPYSL